MLAQPKDPSSDGAKPKASHAVSFECRWADAPLVIDGVADEADWKRAETISQFTKPWIRGDAKSPKTSTKARLLWDRQYLYFFAEMQDADL